MTFDPHEFRRVARELAAGHGRAAEAELRTGVGRLYYAVFLVARELLLARQLLTRRLARRKPHQHVIDALKRKDYALGTKAEALFKLRVEADYSLTPSEPRYRNWRVNWQQADAIAGNLLQQVRRI